MQPLGRKPKINGLEDHRIHDKNGRKVGNWHDEICSENKGGERSRVRDELNLNKLDSEIALHPPFDDESELHESVDD